MAEMGQKRRWMPIVLGLSLALNLAVVAAVGGAAWRHSGAERAGPRAAKGGALYMKALPKEARRAIREQLRGVARPERTSTQMVIALRQEPFDPAAATRVLEMQRDAGAQRQALVSAAWLEQVSAMSAQERSTYADRIEEMAARGAARRNRSD